MAYSSAESVSTKRAKYDTALHKCLKHIMLDKGPSKNHLPNKHLNALNAPKSVNNLMFAFLRVLSAKNFSPSTTNNSIDGSRRPLSTLHPPNSRHKTILRPLSTTTSSSSSSFYSSSSTAIDDCTGANMDDDQFFSRKRCAPYSHRRTGSNGFPWSRITSSPRESIGYSTSPELISHSSNPQMLLP